MAIAFDAVSSTSSAADSASTLSWSHTCTGSDLSLVVAAYCAADATVTGVTYNGVAMTQKVTKTQDADVLTELWYLASPATGSNTVEITYSGSITRRRGIAVSLTGTNGTTGVTASGGQGTGTSFSLAATTQTDNSWIVDGYGDGGSGTGLNFAATGTNQTQRAQVDNDANPRTLGLSTQTTTTAGSYTGSITLAAATLAYVRLEVKEGSQVSGPANLKSLDTNVKANIKSYNTNVLANIKSINTNA